MPPREHISVCRKILIVTPGRYFWHLVDRDRMLLRPYNVQDSHTTKNYPIKNVKSAAVEKL